MEVQYLTPLGRRCDTLTNAGKLKEPVICFLTNVEDGKVVKIYRGNVNAFLSEVGEWRLHW